MNEPTMPKCARGCTIARRHRTDCEDRDECRGCLPRDAEHGRLCYGCHVQLVDWLDHAAAQHAMLLASTAPADQPDYSAVTTAKIGDGLRGHMLAFGGTRTWHRLACAVEDAGFEVRDSIAWLYGSGFPKSMDVSKAIDKAAGAQREEGVPGRYAARRPRAHVEAVSTYQDGVGSASSALVTAPATPAAERWQGWGTALKPAFEPVVVARKPLAGTVAANVLAHGTGALNIDGCRVATDEKIAAHHGTKGGVVGFTRGGSGGYTPGDAGKITHSAGRWPTNVVLDGAMAEVLDEQSGELTSGANPTRRGSDKFREAYGDFKGQEECTPARGVDVGGASRFFYCAKADQGERPKVNGTAHPTVKPLDLMRWLVRLVTPPGGTVLEPFAGSGTTVEACIVEHFRCIAIEKGEEYLPLITQRINRRRDPVAYIETAGEDAGLLGLIGEDAS